MKLPTIVSTNSAPLNIDTIIVSGSIDISLPMYSSIINDKITYIITNNNNNAPLNIDTIFVSNYIIISPLMHCITNNTITSIIVSTRTEY